MNCTIYMNIAILLTLLPPSPLLLFCTRYALCPQPIQLIYIVSYLLRRPKPSFLKSINIPASICCTM